MTRLALLFALVVLSAPAFAHAQAGGGGAPPAGGVRFGGGPVDPAAFRQKQLDTIKEKMAATDDEWNALSAKIEKVIDAKRDASTGAGMSMTSAVGRGAVVQSTGGGNIGSEPGKAMQELRKSLEDKDASDEELAKKLAAMREARDKARQALADAQKELQSSCNKRQEVVLVTLGILE
jgi:hypothetical protein